MPTQRAGPREGREEPLSVDRGKCSPQGRLGGSLGCRRSLGQLGQVEGREAHLLLGCGREEVQRLRCAWGSDRLLEGRVLVYEESHA